MRVASRKSLIPCRSQSARSAFTFAIETGCPPAMLTVAGERQTYAIRSAPCSATSASSLSRSTSPLNGCRLSGSCASSRITSTKTQGKRPLPGARSSSPPFRHSGGTRYAGADFAWIAVLRQLLAHHPRRRPRREAEPLAQRDPALERVAVGHALVVLAAEVPRLVREHGDRARGLAERALVALEREPVEPVADLRRQEGVRAADLGDAVRVLDDPDRLALAVAADPRVVAGDPRRLGRETRLGPPLVLLVEAAPAALRQEDEQQHEPGEDEHAFEPRQQASARPDDPRPALDVGRHPDLVALGLDEHRLEPLGPAELLDVLGQRCAPALAARRFALAPAGDEELHLERGEGEEGDPGRDRAPQQRHEEPREHEHDGRDSEAPLHAETVEDGGRAPTRGLTVLWRSS